MLYNNRGLALTILLSVSIAVAAYVGAVTIFAGTRHVVSQKDKRFGPSDIKLHAGDYITIVNDDGAFIHQAYIEASAFAFESGDIEPGASTVIWFPRDGDFTVLCGIHPKMRLAVHVQG